MEWSRFAQAAASNGWYAFLGTADQAGRPHVSVVAPGFGGEGSIWFATRASSKKGRNLSVNSEVGLHWPLRADGPGELAAWGTAWLFTGEDDRHRLWGSGILPYDLAEFFRSPDNPDLAFVEVEVERARLLGPGFVREVWTPR